MDAQQPWKRKGGIAVAGALESGESETMPPDYVVMHTIAATIPVCNDAAYRMDRDVFVSRINLDGVHSSTLCTLACSTIIILNGIIAFFHIHRYMKISKRSISGGRIWV